MDKLIATSDTRSNAALLHWLLKSYERELHQTGEIILRGEDANALLDILKAHTGTPSESEGKIATDGAAQFKSCDKEKSPRAGSQSEPPSTQSAGECKTPRTDAKVLVLRTAGGREVVHAEFARQLEQELNLAELKSLHSSVTRTMPERITDAMIRALSVGVDLHIKEKAPHRDLSSLHASWQRVWDMVLKAAPSTQSATQEKSPPIGPATAGHDRMVWDAARYRWLRDASTGATVDGNKTRMQAMSCYIGPALDDEVDRAMANRTDRGAKDDA